MVGMKRAAEPGRLAAGIGLFSLILAVLPFLRGALYVTQHEGDTLHLADLGADVIKIDMEFLQETVNVDRSWSILSALIRLIGQLHMDVITEGVETEEQVEALAQMGCQHFQGYYFCRPMPVDQFEKKYRI